MKNGSNTAIRSETAIVMIDVFVIGITLRTSVSLQKGCCTQKQGKRNSGHTKPKVSIKLFRKFHSIKVFKRMRLKPAHTEKHSSSKTQQKEENHIHNLLLFVHYMRFYHKVNRKR